MLPALVLWVKLTHVEGTQYDDIAASPTETVAQFKRRWLAKAKLDYDPSLVTLRLVKCGPDKLTKVPAERDAAEAAAATLYPEDTLVEAGVADGSWLVAVTVSPGECGQLTCFPRRAAHAPDSAATQSTVSSRAPRAAQSGA